MRPGAKGTGLTRIRMLKRPDRGVDGSNIGFRAVHGPFWVSAGSLAPRGDGEVSNSGNEPPPTYEKTENVISLAVRNSSRAGVPSSVLAIARLMAGTISPGSLTRSPWPPRARAKSA